MIMTILFEEKENKMKKIITKFKEQKIQNPSFLEAVAKENNKEETKNVRI